MALLAVRRTCDSQVTGSSSGWALLGKIQLCASVTKQYNLVPASRWESNCRPGRK